MVLEPFDPCHAATVSTWARTESEVGTWCGRRAAPVPAEVIVAWGREAGVHAQVLVDQGRLVAYGELWVDDAEQEVELARLIVAPDHRSRGVGRRLTVLLTERARRLYPRVFVRVRPDNAAALRCYAAAGFARAAADDEERWNRGQPDTYVWMAHR